MNITSKTALGMLSHLWTARRVNDLAPNNTCSEPPLRAELFSADQMEQHGKTLAASHTLSPGHTPDRLLTRLAENEVLLIEVRNLLTTAAMATRRITPAGEWLLDNFYLIEEQIRTTRRHLPKGYSRELPHLVDGPSAKLPRVYDIAIEMIAHGDGRVDPEILSRFVAAYQTVTPLKLGELWAIPIMLRLALIENLRRVSARIAAGRIDRNLADYWADQMTERAEKDPKNLILLIADMARSEPPMVSSFIAEMTRRLQGQGPALSLPLTWLEQRLSESGQTIQQLVLAENQQQAGDQVSMSNSIGSLRFLDAMDWREFVETMSIVEQTLCRDPDGVYGKMDFATRDHYRHVVEKMARHSRFSESDVAERAVRLAQAGKDAQDNHDAVAHVGFYLIGKGLPQLEQALNPSYSLLRRLQRGCSRIPLFLYLGTIAGMTALLTAGLLTATQVGMYPKWLILPFILLSVLGASQLAAALTNWLATLLATPDLLPRMDFSKGIPPEFRTLVVVPTMLTSAPRIEDLVEALEVRFLANRDVNLYFGLLTDFQDAPEATRPEDEPLLRLARQKIEALNDKYLHGDTAPFFLFHRPRQWNAQDRIWMGYERKRGKLAALNALLRGEENTTNDFSLVIGDTTVLPGVTYVITLDTDTALPRDTAWQLVGAMAHPLNHPRYDEDKRRICEGYGILQPRVTVSLSSMNRSRYAALCGNEPGIDPYTRAVSDVYQDLFGEGSFIGKGIYEVDAFERALRDRFPENRILSHDLLEGCYARAGLLSDVLLCEDYPHHYAADVNRRHRWIRGDWQLLRWLLPRVPDPDGSLRTNPLSWLSQWKLFDNLRRSLVPPALVLLLLLGWSVSPAACLWTLAVLGIILIPALTAALVLVLRKPSDVLLSQHFSASLHAVRRQVSQAVFTFICLPYEAFFSLDAIGRTIWRLLIGHKRLLEWNTSEERHAGGGTTLLSFCRTMWFAPVLAGGMIMDLALSRPALLGVAGPILGLWSVSPFVAWWISRPIIDQPVRLTDSQITFLRKLSRRTWAFFEAFVGPDDHWLPPDNFQEQPAAAIAHRTSPTNMGLALLANLSAYDFGYITAGQLLERTAYALHTMESLERYRGHFYNWYDTQSLQPLPPIYISTVDSGNLAGHLLTLRQGLIALPDAPLTGSAVFDGISDTLGIIEDVIGNPATDLLAELHRTLKSAADSPPDTPAAVRHILEQLLAATSELLNSIDGLDSAPESQLIQALAGQCRAGLDELTHFAPLALLPDKDAVIPGCDVIPTLRQLANSDITAGQPLHGGNPNISLLAESIRRAKARIDAIDDLARRIDELTHMEYDFLFDEERNLLAIGYNVNDRRRDASYYDLLASEARFCSFIAIAQGQLPQESWFALGRLLTRAGREQILLSWSGSMFEYLMPLLVMPTYEHTLLDQTCKAAVARQIEYGKKRGVPWGSSESGYNAIDIHLNYQYRAFGVPGLGIKRGLADDLVIAPYASTMALMVAPEAACLNLERLAAEGVMGSYGFHEAVDYTPTRLPRGQASAVVRSFMAHHQGMSLLSLAYVLLDRPMQKRFEAEPMFQATLLLLQERIPKATSFYVHAAELSEQSVAALETEAPIRLFSNPNTPKPEVHLLSNGRYHVMITNAGSGYSRWKDMAVTRWREDATRDHWGTFCYLRDPASGDFWSTTYQPALKQAATYETIFSAAKAEFRCRNRDLDSHTEVAVSPEDDIEVRRITLTNRSGKPRTIDVTSYAEVVLTSPVADALHPAFSNLFVQTEILRRQRAILCTRRPRSLGEAAPWMFHLMAVHGADIEGISYETDRMPFIGRGNTVADPQAMGNLSALSGSEGSVLDPIVSIRYRITLDAEESATINIVTGIGETRDAALSLIGKYQDRRLADRVFYLAWTHSDVFLRQINATEADAQLFGNLAGSMIYANASLRADAGIIIQNQRGQSGLWGYAISGDLPILLLRIEDPANIELARQLIQAHTYWRLKGLAVDLVIWNEDHAGYRQLLHEQIMGLIAAGVETGVTDQPGGIFVRPADQISDEERILLQTVARAIITDTRGTLADQINRRCPAELTIPPLTPTRTHRNTPPAVNALPRPDLLFFNGFGGFTNDGREYIITTAPGQITPAPWVNVLANPHFGSVISESGSAYTWAENAHEFRLTPWYNDPVSDPTGEAFYLRDEERGPFWSPMPQPSRGPTPYVTRHGFGYSVFEHTERGIRSEAWVYVATDASVKFTVLKIRNESDRSRRLSATGYAEWVLGDLRPKTTMHVITEIDPLTGAIFARNPYNTEFPERTAFFDTDDINRTVSGDRREFLGRNGSLAHPAAMTRARLSGKAGPALDPCAAIQVSFELAAGQEREIIFRLGAGGTAEEAGKLAQRFRGSAAARAALEAVWQYWQRTLGAVTIETPDPSLNVLVNGWLLYQTLACRLWARSGYYQSGGAFGFRDQLQDVMALIHAEPDLVREHLLRAAGRQFSEGDVQHWWHPPQGRGVRTHCSDDYLWLPLATCHYARSTGDESIWDESIPFLQGRPVSAGEDSCYDLPGLSREEAGMYEHCKMAIVRGLTYGQHGLPLMGSGDWNDGMNMVGIEGRGESVWLGFFLYDVLTQFTEVSQRRGDSIFSERCRVEAMQLKRNLEQHGWDGRWYRRAYFDDGSPLGSIENVECRIDSIAQSWSVLSGAGDPTRSRLALEAADAHLVRRNQALVQLLDPPFDKSDLNPGYIKGYVPGVRENGGQYTHGAIWLAMAFARSGDRRRAWELLNMINPVNHARSEEAVAIYKVEPYVVAADVYALSPHTGRGGWTWYTGSAGWMYRLIIESLLGIKREADTLKIAPILPPEWNGFTLTYRYRQTLYNIAVRRLPEGGRDARMTVNGTPQRAAAIRLVDDRKEHAVVLEIPDEGIA